MINVVNPIIPGTRTYNLPPEGVCFSRVATLVVASAGRSDRRGGRGGEGRGGEGGEGRGGGGEGEGRGGEGRGGEGRGGEGGEGRGGEGRGGEGRGGEGRGGEGRGGGGRGGEGRGGRGREGRGGEGRYVTLGKFGQASLTMRAKPLVYALVTARLDYANALLYGLPQTMLQRLHVCKTALPGSSTVLESTTTSRQCCNICTGYRFVCADV